jgi:hypothetical protein
LVDRERPAHIATTDPGIDDAVSDVDAMLNIITAIVEKTTMPVISGTSVCSSPAVG